MTRTLQQFPVVVLNRVGNLVAIWYVNLEPDLGVGRSRLTGAWVLDIECAKEIRTLVDGFYVVECVAGLELPQEVMVAGRLDLDAMAESVRAEIDFTDDLFTKYVEGMPKSKQPVRPGWPAVLYPANTLALTQRVQEVVRPALAAAHSLKDLAVAWAAFEALRVARPFLADHAGPDVRSFPLIAH
jgi:hypothetical protein